MHATQAVAHAELGDHAAGNISGPLQIVARTGAGFAKDQFLGRNAAHETANLSNQFGAGGQHPLFFGKVQRIAQSHAARIMLILCTGSVWGRQQAPARGRTHDN